MKGDDGQAMNMFCVEYGKLSSIRSDAQKMARRLDKRVDDYNGIIKKLNKLPDGSRHNISSAISSIKRKNSSMEEKINALNSFAQKCDDYADKAKQTDKTVANRINRDTDRFKQTNNISISFVDYIKAGVDKWIRDYFGRAGRWGREAYSFISDKARDIKTGIRNWYHDEGGKYIVAAVKDFALAAIAIAGLLAPGAGALAVAVALFSVYKSAANIGYDVAAYSSYKKNRNKAMADRLDDSGGRELFVEGAGFVAQQTGSDEESSRKKANLIYTGLELASFGYGAYKGTKGLIKSWKSFKMASGGSFNPTEFKKNLKTFNDMKKMNMFYDAANTPSNPNGNKKLAVKMIQSMRDGNGKLRLMQFDSLNKFRKNIKSFNVLKIKKAVDGQIKISEYDSRRFKLINQISKISFNNYSPILSKFGGGSVRVVNTLPSMLRMPDLTHSYRMRVVKGAAV